MPEENTPIAANISPSEMEGFVARFQNLHGSEEAFVDSRLPGAAWRPSPVRSAATAGRHGGQWRQPDDLVKADAMPLVWALGDEQLTI